MAANPPYPRDDTSDTIPHHPLTFKMALSEMSHLRQTPKHITVRDVSALELEGEPGLHKRNARDEPECQNDAEFPRTSELKEKGDGRDGLSSLVPRTGGWQTSTTNLLNVPAAEENTSSTTTAAINNERKPDIRPITAINDEKEQMIQLRIKNAVLENELLHAEKAKQDALQGALFLARVLGGSVGRGEGDFEALGKRTGKARKGGRERRGQWFGESGDGDESSNSEYGLGRSRSRFRRVHKGIPGLQACLKSKKGKCQQKEEDQGVVEHDSTSKSKSADTREQFLAPIQPDSRTWNYSAGIAHSHHDHGPTSKGLGFSAHFNITNNHDADGHQQPRKSWENSFNHTSFSTTVPNTPLLEHKPSNKEQGISSLQLGQSLLASQANALHGTSFRSHEESANFGISSLEDLLDSDASANRHSRPGGMSKVSKACLGSFIGISGNVAKVDDLSRPTTNTALIDIGVEPENSGLSPEMKIAMDQLASFTGHKEPIPLKAGFELRGSFRADALDEDFQTPTAPRSMREYNRFTPPTSFSRRDSDRRMTNDVEWRSRLEHDSPLRDIFGSFEEEKSAVEAQLRHGPYVNFFKYGVKYVPKEGDRNYLRGVIISNLPVDIELKDVLDRVRGGAIVSAILMDTVKFTGSRSALITFVLEESAKDYVSHTQLHPISFGDQQATTTLLRTPTWPLDNRILNAIHRLHRTRCLSIPSFPTAILLSTLRSHLQTGPRGPSLLQLHISAHGTLHVEFSSLSAASAAFAFLTSHGAYQYLEVFFESDPCAGPVEDIALPPTAQPFETNVEMLISSSDQIVAPVKVVDINEQIVQLQRKRLAASTRQRIEIPSFSGRGIKSASWADEVVEGLSTAENVAMDDDSRDFAAEKHLTPSQRCEFKWDRVGKSSTSEGQTETLFSTLDDNQERAAVSDLKSASTFDATGFEAAKKEEKNDKPMNPDEILLDLSE